MMRTIILKGSLWCLIPADTPARWGAPLFVPTALVEQLWRYPVKSLAGEALSSAAISNDGVTGDRLVHVRGPEGVRTSRRQHRLLGLRGTLGADGSADHGLSWSSPAALALVREAAGQDAELVAYRGIERFDVLPLLVATDGAVAEFGRDVRRLRPNLVIGGVQGLAERDWEGATLESATSLSTSTRCAPAAR